MKVIETNGLLVLGEGVIELVAVMVDVLKAVPGMGVVGIQKDSVVLHFIHEANGEWVSGKRWSMPRALSAASFGLLNQRLDPGAGEGQGPRACKWPTQTHPFLLNTPGQSSGPAQVASGVDPSKDRPLARAAFRCRGCVCKHLSLPNWQRHGEASRSALAHRL